MNAITDNERSALVRVPVEKWDADQHMLCEDDVAEEVPVALEYNGISHAVMLASPYDLEDFALGFSLSEGILKDRSEMYECEIVAGVPGCEGIQVQMQIASERFVTLKDKRRNLTGRTGCGLCGAETLAQAIRHPQATTGNAMFSAAQIHAGMKTMFKQQRLQRHTGATHAAAWMSLDGKVELVREDVGRHNALDKLIGVMAREKRDLSAGAALITSRASYEMVQKAATMGIGFLAAISAPTSLAIQLAEEANVTLVGFVRDRSHVVYAQSHRLIREKSKQRNQIKETEMSSSTVDTLVTMANQIGDFFETMRDRNKSLDEIAGHLKRSWDPRMRRALMEHVEQHEGAGLKAIVLEAVRTHKMI